MTVEEERDEALSCIRALLIAAGEWPPSGRMHEVPGREYHAAQPRIPQTLAEPWCPTCYALALLWGREGR